MHAVGIKTVDENDLNLILDKFKITDLSDRGFIINEIKKILKWYSCRDIFAFRICKCLDENNIQSEEYKLIKNKNKSDDSYSFDDIWLHNGNIVIG